ncbi:zinc-finger homeodomain protein 11-like [Pistacia vera]|uniref:zinc-finger homeodomain protein 11-like n=1 Tax=Pistacia vera TaxID=55513 RepID=UPI0012637767|nr:zinc-finger homeodomain protein 11-like [Pistacia vera]
MDLTDNINTTNTITNPHTETQSPPSKSLSFTNASFLQPQMVVSYKECLKKHAASLGGHALDGCGEFMPSPTANSTDPSSLKCAACGCHRNFHRRDPYDPTFPHSLLPPPLPPASGVALPRSLSPSTDPSTAPSPDTNSPQQQVTSPAPCSYYSSAPHMLLALSTAYSGPSDDHYPHHQGFNLKMENVNPSGRKRSRTKFSKEQKEKMFAFAEKLGWRMNRGEERLTQEFCSEVGVSRRVFKVWMHNNKQAFGKKGLDLSTEINKKNEICVNGYAENGNNQREENASPPKSEE